MRVYLERIAAEYRRRAAEIPADFYSLTRPANLFLHQSWQRAAAAALVAAGLVPLADKRILEVGPGRGRVLVKKWDWLRASNRDSRQIRAAARCLSQFFHKLRVLAMLEEYGARRENLAGIELDPVRHEACARRFPTAQFRQGDAAELPQSRGFV